MIPLARSDTASSPQLRHGTAQQLADAGESLRQDRRRRAAHRLAEGVILIARPSLAGAVVTLHLGTAEIAAGKRLHHRRAGACAESAHHAPSNCFCAVIGVEVSPSPDVRMVCCRPIALAAAM